MQRRQRTCRTATLLPMLCSELMRTPEAVQEGLWQAILDDEALPERQQDKYAYQRDAQEVRNDSPQLWSIHLLQAWHQL